MVGAILDPKACLCSSGYMVRLVDEQRDSISLKSADDLKACTLEWVVTERKSSCVWRERDVMEVKRRKASISVDRGEMLTKAVLIARYHLLGVPLDGRSPPYFKNNPIFKGSKSRSEKGCRREPLVWISFLSLCLPAQVQIPFQQVKDLTSIIIRSCGKAHLNCVLYLVDRRLLV